MLIRTVRDRNHCDQIGTDSATSKVLRPKGVTYPRFCTQNELHLVGNGYKNKNLECNCVFQLVKYIIMISQNIHTSMLKRRDNKTKRYNVRETEPIVP